MRNAGSYLLTAVAWIAVIGLLLPLAVCAAVVLAFLIYAWWALAVQCCLDVLHVLGLPEWYVPFFHTFWGNL